MLKNKKKKKLMLKQTTLYICLFFIFFNMGGLALADEVTINTLYESDNERCYSLCFREAEKSPSNILPQSRKIPVEAGPIWNQTDANSKCPDVAKANNAVWDGQWWTTVPGAMSVCEISFLLSGK